MRRSSLRSRVAEEPYNGLAARSAAKEQSLTSQGRCPSRVLGIAGISKDRALDWTVIRLLARIMYSFRACVMRRSSLCSRVAEEPYNGLPARSAAKEQSLTSHGRCPSPVLELLGYQGQRP